jgi:hypothetical protein
MSQQSGTIEWLGKVVFTNANTGTAVGTRDLLRVSFMDANTGMVVGWSGIILRTTDGGENWKRQTSGTLEWLGPIVFTDASIGIALGTGATIL